MSNESIGEEFIAAHDVLSYAWSVIFLILACFYVLLGYIYSVNYSLRIRVSLLEALQEILSGDVLLFETTLLFNLLALPHYTISSPKIEAVSLIFNSKYSNFLNFFFLGVLRGDFLGDPLNLRLSALDLFYSLFTNSAILSYNKPNSYGRVGGSHISLL